MSSPIPLASTDGKPIPHVLVPTSATVALAGTAESADGATNLDERWSVLPVSGDSATVVSALRQAAGPHTTVPPLALLSYVTSDQQLAYLPQVVLLPSSVAVQADEIERLNAILAGEQLGLLGPPEAILGVLPATADTAALLAAQADPELPTPPVLENATAKPIPQPPAGRVMPH
jgi:hypothetical protein